jgi:hypothetical protein
MGVYMGVFNMFIVFPEIVAALSFGPLIRIVFGAGNPNSPLYVVMMGGKILPTWGPHTGVISNPSERVAAVTTPA